MRKSQMEQLKPTELKCNSMREINTSSPKMFCTAQHRKLLKTPCWIPILSNCQGLSPDCKEWTCLCVNANKGLPLLSGPQQLTSGTVCSWMETLEFLSTGTLLRIEISCKSNSYSLHLSLLSLFWVCRSCRNCTVQQTVFLLSLKPLLLWVWKLQRKD